MAITLEVDSIIAKTVKRGAEVINLSAGEWIHYRYGDPSNPTVILLEQVPAGKAWRLTANIYIEETDA